MKVEANFEVVENYLPHCKFISSFEIHYELNQLKAARKINETEIDQFNTEVLQFLITSSSFIARR